MAVKMAEQEKTNIGKIDFEPMDQTTVGPNILRCSTDGYVLRALLYNGEFAHKSYCELIDPLGNRFKTHHFVGLNYCEANNRTRFLSEKYSMVGDLLLAPDQIVQTKDADKQVSYANIIMFQERPLVYRYHINEDGHPVAQSLSYEHEFTYSFINSNVLCLPPQELSRYAIKFN